MNSQGKTLEHKTLDYMARQLGAPRNTTHGFADALSRRGFVGALAAGAIGAPLMQPAQAQSNSTAHIVIAGAGAAGITMASRLRALLPQARITIIDARKAHYYQPGFTLIAAGVYKPSAAVDESARFLPRDVNWVQSAVAEFDPAGNSVTTESGQKIAYDFLVVATGLKLDFEGVAGFDQKMLGSNGVASVYASPQSASDCFRMVNEFMEKGGTGLFGRPITEMKCAGAPLKFVMIADDRMRTAGLRGKTKLIYNAPVKNLFGVVPVHERLVGLFKDRDIAVNYDHDLIAVDLGKKRATYKTPSGNVEMDYDFLHLVPPMRAPDAVRKSPLAWQSGALAADGWVEANRDTLRHPRFPNVFTVGDIAGVPRGKTAASVKWQAPVAAENLAAVIAGKEPKAIYNGYTSCPLITAIGKAMLVEFDYAGKLTPSFPFIDPLHENWLAWAMKEQALKPMYYAMLRGRM